MPWLLPKACPLAINATVSSLFIAMREKVTRNIARRAYRIAIGLGAFRVDINECLVLLLFVAVELGFSYFHFPTPLFMVLVAGGAVAFRCGEFFISRRPRVSRSESAAAVSIAFGLLLPYLLAVATRQFHTHYFGLLILPVLETALYFSLGITVTVAALSGGIDLFWVIYAAHFNAPFRLGELLETATMILLFLVVAPLVWTLLDLLNRREMQLADRLQELELSRAQVVEGEKLAAVGRLASSVAHEIRNPVAIISSAMEAAARPHSHPRSERRCHGLQCWRQATRETDDRF